ncbi:SGNH/GDSL hydrolase family protein [Rhizobium binxianense]|uniref:SGNH/GDSL hydrolase family protein n=1 Tax=Rhizobium binxianense TaxID=3024242 RepID=UPI00235F723E|nr:SGNH/GDSL hydrolase family protein [Rhizobium sp. MJ37]MDC9837959.1 SGNH/GDSL hydrolase family protein [Rhizobium sp. MJ37]
MIGIGVAFLPKAALGAALQFPLPGTVIDEDSGTATTDQHRPLPTLPLPVGTRVSAIGDSHIGYGVYAGTPLVPGPSNTFAVGYSMANGFIEWARAFDPRFDHDSWYDTADPTGRNICGANQGIFGAHLEWNNEAPSGILTRLPVLLSKRPAIIILEGGTNSINSGDIAGRNSPAAAAEIIAKIEKGLRLARAAGTWVILMTIYPRGDWPKNDVRHKIIVDSNKWIRTQQGRDGVLGIVDGNDDILAPGGIQDLTMYQQDKIHLAPKGARKIGKEKLLPILQAAISAGSTFNPNPAVENLAGAGLGRLDGIEGEKADPEVTGQVPSGFRCDIVRNAATVACSIDELDGPMRGARLVVTPSDNNDAAYTHVQFSANPIAIAGRLVPGDWIYAGMFVEQLAGDQLGTARIVFKLQLGKILLRSVGGLWTSSGDFAHPVGAAKEGWWIKTNPFLMPDLPFNTLKCDLDITSDKKGTPFTVRLSRFIIRKIADPRLT